MHNCPGCGFALPLDPFNAAGPCEQCALEAGLVAAIEHYLGLAAEFEAFCAARDARAEPEPDCHGAVCLYPHGCPGGCRFHDTYAPPPNKPKAPPC